MALRRALLPTVFARHVLAVADVVLVDERDKGKRRLFAKRPARLGVAMRQERLCPGEIVRERRLVAADNLLLEAVQVIAFHLARDVEVRLQVKAFRDAGGDEGVEPAHLRRVEREAVRTNEVLLVLVNAHGVPAEASEQPREGPRVIRRLRSDGVEDHVRAEKALRHVGQPLEFEMVAPDDDAPVTAGRGVDIRPGRGVGRRAGLDPRIRRERHPVAGVARTAGGSGQHGRRRQDQMFCHRSLHCLFGCQRMMKRRPD